MCRICKKYIKYNTLNLRSDLNLVFLDIKDSSFDYYLEDFESHLGIPGYCIEDWMISRIEEKKVRYIAALDKAFTWVKLSDGDSFYIYDFEYLETPNCPHRYAIFKTINENGAIAIRIYWVID